MKKKISKIILIIFCAGLLFSCKKEIESNESDDKNVDELVQNEMNDFLNNNTENSGLLFGMLNQETNELTIKVEGKIEASDELKLACITSKPCISYMVLKEGLNINQTIEEWFPVADGYKKSDQITLKMLMSNSSGIKEYVTIVEQDPEYTLTPDQAINLAYRNQNLLFEPGQNFSYSNTGFVILSLILEQVTGKSLNELIEFHFENMAPSLRLDDGNANYPKGYPDPFPVHWSVISYAAGFVGTVEDVLVSFSYISQQPEFSTMTRYELGIFKNGPGDNVIYNGNIWGCSMLLLKSNNMIYYFHATGQCDLTNIAYNIKNIINYN